MSSHTPGPWQTCEPYTIVKGGKCSSDQDDIAYVNEVDPHAAQANARLIAAAPCLLETLEFALSLITNHESGHHMAFQACESTMKAAIAKAKGQEND